MTTPVVVGIDAGGTKTRAFVVTRTGEVVGRGAGGGANLLTSPDPQGAISAALSAALDGRLPSAVVLSCAALALGPPALGLDSVRASGVLSWA